MEHTQDGLLSQIVSIPPLTQENCRFSLSEGGFLLMEKTGVDKIDLQRVVLHRAFPFEYPYRFISVLDTEQKELGIIDDIAVFDANTRKLLFSALERRYYMPIITKIDSIKERFGFSFWKCRTNQGNVSFSVKDTHRSIWKVGKDRLVISDAEGARYEIPDVKNFDQKSFRKIELYL